MNAGTASVVAIESALMVAAYALNHLGCALAHFADRRANEIAPQFRARFRALCGNEAATEIFYTISNESIVNSLRRFRKYLRSKIIVEY